MCLSRNVHLSDVLNLTLCEFVDKVHANSLPDLHTNESPAGVGVDSVDWHGPVMITTRGAKETIMAVVGATRGRLRDWS